MSFVTAVRFSLYSLACFQFSSCTGQNYWMLTAEREGIFLISRAVLAIERAWLLDADWLSTLALSWFCASNRFWKLISETYRSWLWSERGYFILTLKNIDMQQSTVFWWKLWIKRILFRAKTYWFASWETFERVGWCRTMHRVTKLHGHQTEG